tara:strand:- start:1086 stop:1199 length:114 start_codon:yes stop_codon:yes gene_type:complete
MIKIKNEDINIIGKVIKKNIKEKKISNNLFIKQNIFN